MKRLICAGLLSALTACAGTPPPNYVPVSKSISFPAVGVESTASLGEDLVRQGIYTETDGIELLAENNIKGYRLSPGFYPQISEDSAGTYHSFGTNKSRDDSGYIMQARDFLGFPLAIPQSIRASKAKQEVCVVVGGLQAPVCDTEHPFRRIRKPALSERDFQQTLIYSGRVGDKIRIAYRESSGNLARPAFSNDAEYDLSSSQEIAYRGARLKILDADNLKIRYVVLKNFDAR